MILPKFLERFSSADLSLPPASALTNSASCQADRTISDCFGFSGRRFSWRSELVGMTNDERNMMSGRWTRPAVYAVEHIASGRCLICSTNCLSKRLYDQRRYLALGRHYNRALQEDLLRDGPSAFKFVVIEMVTAPSDLRQRRQRHLDAIRQLRAVYNAPDPPHRSTVQIAPSGAALGTDRRQNQL